MSSKQLAQTVKDGRILTFHFPIHEATIEGYLCGMDDYHWLVVTLQGTKHLIHKGNVSVVDIADQPTYQEKDKTEDLERIIAPFRGFIEAKFFGKQEAMAS